jgi:hypothetical protein
MKTRARYGAEKHQILCGLPKYGGSALRFRLTDVKNVADNVMITRQGRHNNLVNRNKARGARAGMPMLDKINLISVL